ncbi:MAG TPA: carboxypeptidase-like regulatory domain-containing protein [Armatimonadota bacterium]|jgi:hypothetical protein
MRVHPLLVLAALSVPCAAAPNQRISGGVTAPNGYAAGGAIVGAKPSTSANPASPLADADIYALTDGYGRYQFQCNGGKTYNMAAIQVVTNGSGAITSVGLPGPMRAAVSTANVNDVQALTLGPAAAPLPLTAASPVAGSALAADGSVATAWTVSESTAAADRWAAFDLGAPTYVAQAILWWKDAAPAGYRLEACNDFNASTGAGSWQTVHATSAGKGYLLPAAGNSALCAIVPPQPLQARYLRVAVDAFAAGAASAALNDISVIPAPALSGIVTDVRGVPVSGAAVGAFLDGGPFVFTDAAGRYTLPRPYGKAVVGAHKEGYDLSGPRWLNTVESAHADFALFPAGDDTLQGNAPTITPSEAAGNDAALVDGSLSTLWTSGRSGAITSASPTRITFALPNVTLSGVEVHWKTPPAGWHIELTNDITYWNGSSPHASTRTYYSAGEGTAADETGGYPSAANPARLVNAIHFAPVYGVYTLSLVITKTYAGVDPVSAFEVVGLSPQPTSAADAAAALRISAGLQQIPDDYNAAFRWDAEKDAVINMADAIELTRDLAREVRPLRVLVVNYQPYIEETVTTNGGAVYAGVPLRSVTGWNDPHVNTKGHVADLELASHSYLRVQLLPQIEADEYPLFNNGYRFTDHTFIAAWKANTWPSGSADFNDIFQHFDIIRRVAVGDVDEVWLQAVPGFAMPETTMAGPNAYWCNSGPVIPPDGVSHGQRLFVTTCFNYERGNDVMLEDWGHRCESILGNSKVYGGWNSASGRTTFDLFTRYDKITPGEAECGNVHYPPNGIADYDFANETYVSSNADDWLNYPNFTGARTMVNRENWAGPHPGDYHRNYHIWWFSRFPHIPGLGPDGKQANWWKYVTDMNAQAESR